MRKLVLLVILLPPLLTAESGELTEVQRETARDTGEKETETKPPKPRKSPLLKLTIQQMYTMETEFDSRSGGLSVLASRLSVQKPLPISRSTVFGLSGSYQFSHFDFENFLLNGTDVIPFENVHDTSLRFSYRQQISDKISTLLIGGVASAMEEGADFSQSLRYSTIAMVNYKWNDSLTTGLGVGAFYDLDDNVRVFPLPMLKWHITDRLDLEAHKSISLSYLVHPTSSLRIGLEGGFASQLADRSFRLSDQGPVPGGIAEFKHYSIGARAKWHPLKRLKIEGFVGALIGSEFQVDDHRGSRVIKEDLRPGVQFSFNAIWAF
jgi:hypothetical protein